MARLFSAFCLGAVAVAAAAAPSLDIPTCEVGTAPPTLVSGLKLSSGEGDFPAKTSVRLCWTKEALVVKYDAADDTYLRNDYSECNSDTYNQEVVELFISPRRKASSSDDFATKYLEVEITPQNTMFVAHIRNPYGNGTDISRVMVGCDVSGISHHTDIDHEGKAFVANVSVPWNLINGHNDNKDTQVAAAGDKYAGNFFRVLMHKSVSICDSSTCAYGAWSPTFVTPPQFHVSKAFGDLHLV